MPVLPACILLLCQAPPAPPRPDVVLILADDLGWGDARAYNPDSKIPTPALDRLAREGVRFTDAHSPSAVCSPTRYGILTGRYAWRTRLHSWVLNGYSRALIEEGRPTLASTLREAGYATAFVGKWHLGLGRFDPAAPGARAAFDGPFDAGPHTAGFEQAFLLPASLDMPPYCFVSTGAGGLRARPMPTQRVAGGRRVWDGGSGYWRGGARAPGFTHEHCLPALEARAIATLEAWGRRRRADEAAGLPVRPFFLEFALTAPHTPWVPLPEFQGRSEAGAYGDFVAQVDTVAGAVLDALDREGLAGNALVVFTSDNGSHWRPQEVERYGHRANGPWRGMKADIHEGGHRVPLLVRWPGHAPGGGVSGALVGLNDLYATLAAALGLQLTGDAAPDSVSFLPAILAPSREPGSGREQLVLHSGDGMFALRSGRWKLIEGLGSGGFTPPARRQPGPEDPPGQLYDLQADPGETRNLWRQRPEVVERLRGLLAAARGSG